jgi:hypothetical protein
MASDSIKASGLNFGSRCWRVSSAATTTDGRTRRYFFFSILTDASIDDTCTMTG